MLIESWRRLSALLSLLLLTECLAGKVRKRQIKGEKGLFYHAGEPSAGLMCLDAVGVAFRSCGWLAWKYRTDGFFDWASNFWGESPYTNPRSFGADNGNMYLL